jgi:hypothetical protein
MHQYLTQILSFAPCVVSHRGFWGLHNRCPQLEELSLKRTGTASAMLHCPRLTSLDVSSCHKLSDAGVRTAAIACPLLSSLNMSNCAYVTDDTLREISLACTHLQTLDASYCPNISLEVTFLLVDIVSYTSLDLLIFLYLLIFFG